MYLLLSITASSFIFAIFKLFAKYKINTLHAIIVNYFVAFTSGILFYQGSITIPQIPSQNWFYSSLILGFIFISIFNLMAITTQKSGLSVVSVATKMSVVIPILFGVLYYREALGLYKIIGIITALIAVYLVSVKAKKEVTFKKKNLVFPILVFLGSGIIDTSLKFIEDSYISEGDVSIFSATVFLSAGVIGLLIIGYQIIKGNFKFEFKNIIAGVCLGVPNFFSIAMLLKALREPSFDSSTIFTINNVAIVMLSTILGILLFKEKLTTKNWIGILLAVGSILLVTIA